MTERERQTTIRQMYGLPFRCECGGLMEYAVDFGRIWSACKKCSPVEKIVVNKLIRKATAAKGE